MRKILLPLLLVAVCGVATARAVSFAETAVQAAAFTGDARAKIFTDLAAQVNTGEPASEALTRLWLLYFLAETDRQREVILTIAPKVGDPDVRVLINTLADFPGVEPQARKAQEAAVKMLATLPGAKVAANGKVSFPDSAFDGRPKHEKFVTPPEWVGRWVAGDRNLDLNLFPGGVIAGKLGKGDTLPRQTVLGLKSEDSLRIVGPDFQVEWMGDHFETLAENNVSFLRKTVGVTGKAAPPGAVVLLDGKGNALWNGKDGKFAWKVSPDGVMEMLPGVGTHASNEAFGDTHLYLEFRHSFNPDGMYALRGNSGIYLQSNYEIQMTDAFGVDPEYFLSGALYRQAAPAKVAVAPPMEWQSLEVIFHAPRYDSAGKKTANARFTVWQNGIKIHDNAQLPTQSGGGVGETAKPLPILIQAHGGLLQFRNIWAEPIKD